MHTCLTQESPGRQSASTLHRPVHKRQMKKVFKFRSFSLTKFKDAHSTRARLNFVTIANPAQPPQPMIIVLPWVRKHTLMVMCLNKVIERQRTAPVACVRIARFSIGIKCSKFNCRSKTRLFHAALENCAKFKVTKCNCYRRMREVRHVGVTRTSNSLINTYRFDGGYRKRCCCSVRKH